MSNLTSISDTHLDLSHYGMRRRVPRRSCFLVDPELVDMVISATGGFS